jgi:phosphoglycerate kinase
MIVIFGKDEERHALKLSVKDLDVTGKRVLVRVDFNVPIEEKEGHISITDDTRIRESLPTIELLRKKGAKVILMAHLGRPKGKLVIKYSLRPIARHLQALIKHPVAFSTETIGPATQEIVAKMQPGDVCLLENVRFHREEEENDGGFARQLANLGDAYVDDAFGSAHRAHASNTGIAKFFPQAAMGLLMERELKYLVEELAKPERPFLVVLGGSKVSSKITVIKSMMEKADTILIGGAMAYTFFLADGIKIGKSLVELEKVVLAKELLDLARARGVKFVLPLDTLEADSIKPGAATRNTSPLCHEKGITDGWEGVDIGARTIECFEMEIALARTILWNGPVGVFEIPEFSQGTRAIAEAIANSGAKSIVGGGDTVTAVRQFGLADQMTFISTGGGATLELLEGRELPGVAALSDE